MGERRDSTAPAASRRADERVEVTWAVDCSSEDTFLYANITNVSAMGLFVQTDRPLDVGTVVHLCFSPNGGERFELDGVVAWINRQNALGSSPNPGMGVRFTDLGPEHRERLVDTIRTIAYLRGDTSN